VVTAQSGAGGVAYMAHVGGFIFGAITARLFEDRRRLAARTLSRGQFYEQAKSGRPA